MYGIKSNHCYGEQRTDYSRPLWVMQHSTVNSKASNTLHLEQRLSLCTSRVKSLHLPPFPPRPFISHLHPARDPKRVKGVGGSSLLLELLLHQQSSLLPPLAWVTWWSVLCEVAHSSRCLKGTSCPRRQDRHVC